MKKPVAITLWLLLFCPPLPAAADSACDLSCRQCLEASGGATAPVSRCLETALEAMEQAIAQRLRQLHDRLPAERGAQLLQIQKNWQAYRDAACRFFHHPARGSGGLLDMQECLLEKSAARLRELEELQAESPTPAPGLVN